MSTAPILDAKAPAAAARPRRTWVWPTLIFVFLGINMVTTGALIVAATSQSMGLEPDYYNKALGWDKVQAQMAANERLGWSVEPRVNRVDEDLASLTLTIADRAGAPVDGAQVRVEVFHQSRAEARLIADLESWSPGVYAGMLSMDRGGLWECRVTATRGDETFTRTLTLELARGERGP